MSEPRYTSQGATFSPDRVYRYLLWRTWDEPRGSCLFVMLNPSTADERVLDPTLRRCLGFAQAWGFGGFQVANLFALRSTDPAGLRAVEDPEGPENDRHLLEAARACGGIVVCAWGVHGEYRDRAAAVEQLLLPHADLVALRLTKAGHPSHPLYLPALLKPTIWRRRTPRLETSR
jgi:hypothetical protein